MNKKNIIAIAVALGIILCGVIGFLLFRMHEQKAESEQMLQLAEMDKRDENADQQRFTRCPTGAGAETY